MLELVGLIYDCFGDSRMAMSHRDCDDAGESVKVPFASFVKEVLHFTIDNHDWGFEMVEDSWVEVSLAEGEDLRFGRACVFRWNVVKGREGGGEGRGLLVVEELLLVSVSR